MTGHFYVIEINGVRKTGLKARAAALGLSNVTFLPFQPKEGLIHSFAAADVFLVTLKEGLAGYIVPSKMYGILAAGRPFVASVEDETEIAEITRAHGCGLLARLGDSRDLAEQIVRLYRDRTLARQMGEKARQAALLYDRPIQVKAHHALLSSLASDREAALSTPFLKRLFDVILSSLGLVFSSPLWALIAIAIKLDDSGPVFYRQARVGRSGKVFQSWKFRSMTPESDLDFGPLAAAEQDPRITRIGRFLRGTAMDELPQLWSILKGDMSFVGPRALMPYEIAVGESGSPPRPLSSIRGYRERHRVTPGLTGVSQIFRPRNVKPELKFRLDRLYIQKRSFWLDLQLISLSFWITFLGRWEDRGDKLG